MNDANKIRKLELPVGSRPPVLACPFVVAIPVFNSAGAMTGMQPQGRACTDQCALYDRVGDRPCLVALREDLVAAIRGAATPDRVTYKSASGGPTCGVCGALGQPLRPVGGEMRCPKCENVKT